MRLLKSFISFLLILSYTLGLAHNIVPHEHDESTGHHKNHSHEHHHSAHDHHSSDIAHAGHHDHNLMDFMKCLLTDLEHIDANLEYVFPQKGVKLKTQAIGHVTILPVSETECLQPLAKQSTFTHSSVWFRPTDWIPSPQSRRGPPILA